MLITFVYISLIVIVVAAAAYSEEPEWLVRALSSVGLRRAVLLIDYQEEERLQFLRTDRLGRNWCHAMGPVGKCILLDDGTVKQPHYQEKWVLYVSNR